MATAPPRQRGHDTGAKRKVTAEPDEGGIKAVRVLAKGWVVEWGEHLRDRLLDQSIEHRRHGCFIILVFQLDLGMLIVNVLIGSAVSS